MDIIWFCADWMKPTKEKKGLCTYGVNPKRSYFLLVQQESYLRLDTWISHWDRNVERLAIAVDFQLHRPYCVRIDRRQVRHLQAIEPEVVVDLQNKHIDM